jgi:hypothetical protein
MATIYHDAEEQFILVNGDNDIDIKVSTGNGQGGGVIVFFENTLIQEKNNKYAIDHKSKFDKWITIVVVIKDKLTQTNWTNVTIDIKESGLEGKSYKYSREVPNHLDTVIYTVKIKVQREN